MSEILPGYTRVSEVIAPFTGVEFVPDEYLIPAANKGTDVHTYIEGYLKGWVWEEIPEHVKPYYDSFLLTTNREFLIGEGKPTLEKRFYCGELKITGQIDLLLETGNTTLIMDWKTSRKESIGWRLQAAAYRYLCIVNGVKNPNYPIFWHLIPNKKANLITYFSYDEDIELFKKCLELYRFFNMDKTRKKRTMT